MIITFEATTDELDATADHELDELFSEIVRASRRGLHYLIMKPNLHGLITARVNLRQIDSAHLQSICSSYSQRAGLLRLAPCYVRISVGSTGIQHDRDGNLCIGHRSLLAGRYLEITTLVVENMGNDGAAFGHILEEVRKKSGLPPINYEEVNGGGSVTPVVYESMRANKRISVALIDGDRSSPVCGPSDMARKITRNMVMATYAGDLFVLPCRDIENLIPVEIILSHGLGSPMSAADLVRVRSIYAAGHGRSSNEAPYHYFDVKDGISLAKVSAHTFAKRKDWMRTNLCGDGAGGHADLPGFGSGIIPNFVQSGPAIADFLQHMNREPWKGHFYDFFRQIVFFLLSDKKVSI